jgi:hypothetical protein
VVGWPPVRAFRKNALAASAAASSSKAKFVKVAVDGAPYLRKVDLEAYRGYDQLLAALQDKFFSHFTIRESTCSCASVPFRCSCAMPYVVESSGCVRPWPQASSGTRR